MIAPRDYWRVMNGGYLHNPHFLLLKASVVGCQFSLANIVLVVGRCKTDHISSCGRIATDNG